MTGLPVPQERTEGIDDPYRLWTRISHVCQFQMLLTGFVGGRLDSPLILVTGIVPTAAGFYAAYRSDRLRQLRKEHA